MKKTKFYSYCKGSLYQGCKLCVRGYKLVLFVTGICPRNCMFCPISDKKKNKDVTYANEWPITNDQQILQEAKNCTAKGASLTGGDPLSRLDRSIKYIRLLKKEFGNNFHIHLYTSLDLVTEKTLKKLHDAGLDEIRFHPSLDSDELWNRLTLAKKFSWKVGVEIPAIPGYEKVTKELLDFINGKVDFLNINELEISDNNFNSLDQKGFKIKNQLSYAIKGSEAMAKKLLKYAKIKNVHYCTAKLKDRVQLQNRLKLRAKKIHKPYDFVTDEGMLFRGAIYSDNDLETLKKSLMKEFKIPPSMIEIDLQRKRLLTSALIVDELKNKLKAKCLKIAIVEEYPTYDRLEVMVDYL